MSSDTKLGGAEGRLANEFAVVFSRETVVEVLHDSFHQLAATAKVRTYLELFAERGSDLGQAHGPRLQLTLVHPQALERARLSHGSSPLALAHAAAPSWDGPTRTSPTS